MGSGLGGGSGLGLVIGKGHHGKAEGVMLPHAVVGRRPAAVLPPLVDTHPGVPDVSKRDHLAIDAPYLGSQHRNSLDKRLVPYVCPECIPRAPSHRRCRSLAVPSRRIVLRRALRGGANEQRQGCDGGVEGHRGGRGAAEAPCGGVVMAARGGTSGLPGRTPSPPLLSAVGRCCPLLEKPYLPRVPGGPLEVPPLIPSALFALQRATLACTGPTCLMSASSGS